MKKIICLFICLFSGIFLCACAKESDYVLNKVKEKGEIVIVTSPDYPPYEFIDTTKTGDAQYVGADVSLMKYIAEKLGVTLKIQAADFDTTLALLQNGAVDLAISGFTYKESRAQNYEMSDPYDSEGTQGVIILASDIEKYPNLKAINDLGSGFKVAAQNGSLQADYVGEYLPGIELESVTKIIDGLTVLENNDKVVALAISSTTAESIMQTQPGKYIYLDETFPVSEEETQIFVLAQKGQTAIIEEINKIIAEVLEKDLYKQWLEEAEEIRKNIGSE